jgi:hypothetical protein
MEHSGVQTLANYIDSFNDIFVGIENLNDPGFKDLREHFLLILTTVLNMLEELCKHGFTHGDTHFSNIMISCDDYTYQKFLDVSNEVDMRKYIKLIDFGNAVTTRCNYNRFLYDIFQHLGTYNTAFINTTIEWIKSAPVRAIFLPESEKENRPEYKSIYDLLEQWNFGNINNNNKHILSSIGMLGSQVAETYLVNHNVYMEQFRKYITHLEPLFTVNHGEDEYKIYARHLRSILDHILFQSIIPDMGGKYSHNKSSYIDFVIELTPTTLGSLSQWQTVTTVAPYVKPVATFGAKTFKNMNFLTLLFTDFFMMSEYTKNTIAQWFIYSKTQEWLSKMHNNDPFVLAVRNLIASKWQNTIDPNQENVNTAMGLLEISQRTIEGIQ